MYCIWKILLVEILKPLYMKTNRGLTHIWPMSKNNFKSVEPLIFWTNKIPELALNSRFLNILHRKKSNWALNLAKHAKYSKLLEYVEARTHIYEHVCTFLAGLPKFFMNFLSAPLFLFQRKKMTKATGENCYSTSTQTSLLTDRENTS